MKPRLSALRFLTPFLLALPLAVQAAATAPRAAATSAPAKAGQLLKVTDKEAAWAAQQKERYPLKECVVSGESLGSMGQPPEYIYRVEGQPDRFVMFCCNGCKKDFLAAPEEALAKLQPGASQPAEGQPAEKHGAKGHHQH